MSASTHTTRAAIALLGELQRRLRAVGYNGPIVTARGDIHPDAERFMESYRDTRHGRDDVARVVR